MTEQRPLKQDYEGQTLEHVIVHDETGRVLPTVILIPTVMGVQPLEIGFAEKLVERGYHAVVVDLFGRRFTPGADKEAAFAAMGELRSDRAALRDRLLAVVDEVRKREHVDASRLAVIAPNLAPMIPLTPTLFGPSKAPPLATPRLDVPSRTESSSSTLIPA